MSRLSTHVLRQEHIRIPATKPKFLDEQYGLAKSDLDPQWVINNKGFKRHMLVMALDAQVCAKKREEILHRHPLTYTKHRSTGWSLNQSFDKRTCVGRDINEWEEAVTLCKIS